MRRNTVAAIAGVIGLTLGLPVTSSAAERLTDKQVKATVENIDRGFDTWKDSLERRNLDDAVIRNAAGTVEVRRFLDDFEKEIHTVKDRVKPEYSADAEVTTLLRRASDVERRAQAGTAQPEWQAMAAQFSALAGAYGTTFPLPSAEATAARLTDNDVAKRLQGMEQQAATQAAALLATAGSAKGLVSGLAMAAPGIAAWRAIDRDAMTLAKAFGQPW